MVMLLLEYASEGEKSQPGSRRLNDSAALRMGVGFGA
jgi:hypothetical protein